MKWVFFLSLFLNGCIENPTSDGKETSLGEAVDGGLSQLNPAEAVTLYSPISSPAIDPTPTIQITGLKNGDQVTLYSDPACSQQITSGNASSTTLLLTLPALNPGTHNFSVKRRWDDANIESPCAQNQLTYQLWNNNLILTGLANDSTPTRSKSWNWGCSGEQTTCEYRFAVTNTSTHTFGNQPWRLIDNAGQTSGTGTFYLHVQARDALHTFLETPVQTYSAILDHSPPGISSLQAPPNATYNLSQSLDFEITFDEAVSISGIPRLELQVGSTTRHAGYHAGSGGTRIIFRHNPVSGDVDLGGINFSSTQIDFNGGNIQDLAGNQAGSDFSLLAVSLAGVNINAASPQVAGLANDSTPKKSKVWNWGCNRPACSYRFMVDQIGASVPTGVYTSTTDTSQDSGDGTYYLHIQVRDQSGDESPVQHFSALLDNTNPQINSLIPPGNGLYSAAQAIDFTLNTNEAVNIIGLPQISLDVGGTTRYASYHSGAGSDRIVFRYLPQTGDSDLGGISFSNTSIDLNGGSLKDAAGNDAGSDFSAIAPALNSIVVDGLNPSIIAMNVPPDASYDSSSNLDFRLDFNERVVITGTPRLNLDVGGSARYANYYSSNATGDELTFRYIPQIGDKDDNGIQFQNSSVSLNGGRISDPAGNNAMLNYPQPIPDISGITIDAQRAEVNGILHPTNGIYSFSQNLNFALTFNRDVNVTGAPRLALLIGGQIRYAQYQNTLSSKTLTFLYTTQNGDDDNDGITFFGSSIYLNGGSISDNRGNAAVLDFANVVPDLSGVIIDSVFPTPVGVANDSVYKKNKNWNWGCSKANCNYRFAVDDNSTTAPISTYSNTSSAAQLGGNGTYYLHLQIRDSLGNESPVQHFSALLDNTPPYFSGSVEIDDNDVFPTRAAYADWSGMTLSDAHSSVVKIEISIGRDVSDDGLDANEVNNVLDWREIPNGMSLNPPRYQIQHGADGFSLDLTHDVDYFTSLRIEDEAGNKSLVRTSDPWSVFTPLMADGLALWLDGKDLGTFFQNEDCTGDITADGNQIGCWRDKSANANHAIQSDLNRKPVYRSGGHVHFDTATDLLNAGNILSGNYNELSVFIVFLQKTVPSHTWPLAFNLNWDNQNFDCSDNSGTGRLAAIMFEKNSNRIYWDIGNCSSNRRMIVASNTSNEVRNIFHLGISAVDNLLFVHKNGKVLDSRNTSRTVYTNASSQAIIGNGLSETSDIAIAGEISEFIVYTEHINTSEREKLEGYLACKWGLQGDLTSDHPYATNCP